MPLRRSALIYNPASGRQAGQRLLASLETELRRSGYDVEPMPTSAPGDATHLAIDLVERGDLEVVFAVGGDGTLREVAAGLLGSDVALAPLAAGTANVLTYELGVPRRPLPAARAYAKAEVREMDVGLAGDIPFLMMASCGLDAQVMAHQSSLWKRRLGVAAVGLSGLGHWWRFDYPEIELRFDGRRERVGFFSLCNIPFFGGPIRLAPRAEVLDGELDLVLFRGRSRWSTVGFASAVALGRHERRGDVEIHRVREVELVGPCPVGLQVDGDVLPVDLPLRLSVAPQRLKVLAVPPPRR
ncbi:MAG: diacylglycerol kinase family protein [Acidobacteriota bacterium]